MNQGASKNLHGGVLQLSEFKSLKEFRKSKEIPKFKFNSDKVKELLDPKSDLYREPMMPEDEEKHQFTWRHKMVPLTHLHSVKFIKEGIDMARSQSYNLLHTMKKRSEDEGEKKIVGREGPETAVENRIL